MTFPAMTLHDGRARMHNGYFRLHACYNFAAIEFLNMQTMSLSEIVDGTENVPPPW